VTENETNVINIQGKDYNQLELTDQQRYWIAQVQDLQQKRQAAQFQLDQVAIAADSFMGQLLTSLSDETKELKEKTNG
jgi:hypothetical protein|tara:strand:+ start:306 stop:539 length:234 start_codon:yes stop_codon:yes gene_type:complete